MKRSESSLRCRTRISAPLSCLALLLLTLAASAVTSGVNPYAGIVERNGFGLKPPVNPADLVKPPPPQTANIKLQGITTILGRKQVLMKLAVPARPPEPAREQSVVLSEGQREGEVEVLEINPAEGSVKVNNAGTILPLNLKEHGEKPTPGAAPPSLGLPAPGALPGVPPPPAVSGLPAPATHPTAGPAGTSVSTFGGAGGSGVTTFGSTANNNIAALGNAAQKAIPTRTLRTSTAGGSGTAQTGGEYQNISPEAQAILIEAARSQTAAGAFDPLPKTAITPADRMHNQAGP